MQTYTPRELLAMSKDQLWSIPKGRHKVQCEDGVLTTTRECTIFSVYCWKAGVSLYPKAKIHMRHHMGDAEFTAATGNTLINALVWDCFDASKETINREDIETAVGSLVNEMYNVFTYELEEWVQTVSYEHCLEIVNDPEVKAINDAIQPTYQSIDKAHRQIQAIIRDPKRFIRNPIANGCRFKTIKIDQVIQCVSARGFLTDIDSNIFRKPILVGYVHGFREIIDLMVDSRQASKAIGNTEKPLQDSQYFNRRMQMLMDTVTDLIPGDCGTTHYMPWLVQPEDIDILDGKYYVERGRLKRFVSTQAAEQGLIGKVLQLRSVLTCISPHPRGFCETCYGEMRHGIVAGTIPGHVAATFIGEKISQILLSTKHLDRSASSSGFDISSYNQQYVKFLPTRNAIVLADNMNVKNLTLIVDANEAARLPDVKLVEDINLLQPTLVSSLSRVQLTVTTTNRKSETVKENIILPVSSGKHMASISKELLQYIKDNDWTTTPNGNYSIDLKNWDQDLPLFTLPAKNANMYEYLGSVVKFLAGGDRKASIVAHKNAFDALREFHSIVSARLSINIVYLEVVIFSCMIRSAVHNDYRLPLYGNDVVFGKFATTVAARSVSALMAYQYQLKALNNPASYMIEHRPNHPFDALMVPPQQVS